MFSRNRPRGRVRPFAIGVVLLAALTGQAFGDVLYTYTGNDYCEFSGPGPFTSLDNLVFSFAVPSALAPSAEYFFTAPGSIVENPSLVGWKSFDGVYSTSSSDLQENPFLYGSVSTNASGNISSWAFTVGIAQTPADGETALSESSCNLVEPCAIFLTVRRLIMFRPISGTCLMSPPGARLPERGHRRPRRNQTFSGF
jgi:hypothetical protein